MMMNSQNERQKLVKQSQQKDKEIKEEKAQNLLLKTQINELQHQKKSEGENRNVDHKLKELQREIESYKQNEVVLKRKSNGLETEKKELRSQVQKLQKQSEELSKTCEVLSRKIKDLYTSSLLPSKDADMSQSFNNSQILYRRADFNLFSKNLRLNQQKIKQNHQRETEIFASRPRRKSIDCLHVKDNVLE